MDFNSTQDHIPSTAFFTSVVVLLCLAVSIGLVGNIAILIYNIFLVETKTPTTYFVVNLSISDIIVCCSFYPSWMVEFINILAGKDSNAKMICIIGVATSGTSAALSIANLLAITYDRFIYISRPLKYPLIMTWRRTRIILATIWLLAIVNANLLLWNTQNGVRRLYCNIHPSVLPVYGVFNLFLPTIAILLLNYKIFKVAKTQRSKVRNSQGKTNVNPPTSTSLPNTTSSTRGNLQRQLELVKTFGIIVGVFLASTLPFMITATVELHVCRAYCIDTRWYIIANLLLGTNSILNPYIYGARNKNFKTRISHLFSRYFRTA